MQTNKIDGLRTSAASSSPHEFSSTESIFDGFRSIAEDELRRVISSSTLKFLELDSLQPFIIIDKF